MKIEWVSSPCVPVEELQRNVDYAKARGFPYPQERVNPGPLAVVGGGPSIEDHVEELRAWPGDVWACGSPWRWCEDHGIDAVFFNIDPLEETIDLARGARHAILSSTNHPGVYDVISDRVEVFDLIARRDLMNHNVTTATAAPHLALTMGYRELTFFGCESSFPEGRTHAYKHEDFECFLWVRCGEAEFVTKPQLLMQSEFLSECVRRLPHVVRERSGGLLAQMVKTPDYDVLRTNEAAQRLLTLSLKFKVESDYGQMFVDADSLDSYLRQGWQLCTTEQAQIAA